MLRFLIRASKPSPDSPERSVSPYGRGGGTPALAASFLLVALLLAQRRGNVSALVAPVGQVLVERQRGPQLGDRRPPRRHVVLADVWHLPVRGAVGLRVTAAAWRGRGRGDSWNHRVVEFDVGHEEMMAVV